MTEWTLHLRRSRLGLIAALVLAVAACGDDDDGNGGDEGAIPGDSPSQPQALLRVVHATPDAPAVDVYLAGAGEPVVEDLDYEEASAFLDIDAGSHSLALRPADAPADSEPIFVSPSIELGEGERTSAIVAGMLEDSEDSEEGEELVLRVLEIEEDFGDPGVGRAMIRLVHASPDLENIEAEVTPGRGTEIPELARFGDATTAGIPVAADEALRVEISALAAWTWTAGMFTLTPLTDGGEVVIVALGRQGSKNPAARDAFSLLVMDGEGNAEIIRQDPMLYTVHGIPDASAVTIAVGDVAQIWNLDYGAFTSGLAVPPGSYELTFTSTEDGEVLGTGSVTGLERARRYLVVAAGFATPEEDEPGLRIIQVQDDFSQESTEDAGQVAVVHGVADQGLLDVSPLEDRRLVQPPAVSELGFGESSLPFDVPLEASTIGAAPTGTIWPSIRVNLPGESRRLFAVLVGALEPSGDERYLQRVLVDASSGGWSLVEN